MTANISTPPNTGIVLPPPKPRRRWLSVLLILFVFLAGMFAGSGLTIAIAVHKIRMAFRHPEQAPARITQFLDRKLHLSADQSIRVQGMITEAQKHLQQIRRDVQPQVKTELDSLRDQVAGVLTPEQNLEWQRLYDDAVETWLPAPPPPAATSTRP